MRQWKNKELGLKKPKNVQLMSQDLADVKFGTAAVQNIGG